MTEDKEKTRSTVEIYGEKYTIVGYENPEHIYKVASIVDNKMREIKEKNQNLDTRKLAVLTALNTVNELLKCEEELERLKKEVKN
ncbi:cell division protein ZapA [Pueribacillus sp. YX66]|uniref:cell division protein ZapA n=1 Tax=Pueribacillus sp. YX66 TaxID=3229242 RepID=UPI00358D838C